MKLDKEECRALYSSLSQLDTVGLFFIATAIPTPMAMHNRQPVCFGGLTCLLFLVLNVN